MKWILVVLALGLSACGSKSTDVVEPEQPDYSLNETIRGDLSFFASQGIYLAYENLAVGIGRISSIRAITGEFVNPSFSDHLFVSLKFGRDELCEITIMRPIFSMLTPFRNYDDEEIYVNDDNDPCVAKYDAVVRSINFTFSLPAPSDPVLTTFTYRAPSGAPIFNNLSAEQ